MGGKALGDRANGRFYTPEFLAERLGELLLAEIPSFSQREVRLVDPFCGDGRLITAFLRVSESSPKFTSARFHISLWDNDSKAVVLARKRVEACAKKLRLRVKLEAMSGDTFLREDSSNYDLLLTNPPWEALKPDRRETEQLTPQARADYITGLAITILNSPAVAAISASERSSPGGEPTCRAVVWSSRSSSCDRVDGVGSSCRVRYSAIKLVLDFVAGCSTKQLSGGFSLSGRSTALRWRRSNDCRCDLRTDPRRQIYTGSIEVRWRSSRSFAKQQLVLTKPELERLRYAIPLDLTAEETSPSSSPVSASTSR